MAERLPDIVWRKAEHLCIEKGRTLEDIETITGISLSALKKRSAEAGWTERRRARMGFLEKMRMMADRTAEAILTTDNPRADDIVKLSKAYKTLADVPEAEWAESFDRMWRAIEEALATEAPAVLPAWEENAGRVRAKAEDILSGDGPGRKTAAKAGKITAETVDQIRKQVLGL